MIIQESQTKIFMAFHYNGQTSITFFVHKGTFPPLFINNTLSPSLRICIRSAGVAYSTLPPHNPLRTVKWQMDMGHPWALAFESHLSWTPQVMALYLNLPPALFCAKIAPSNPLWGIPLLSGNRKCCGYLERKKRVH